MGLIQEYIRLQQKHEALYGERTVTLMQVGTFYEIYEYDPAYCLTEEAMIDSDGVLWDKPIGHAAELSVILNYALTMEDNNEPYSVKNPCKLGFPLVTYEKNR